jgi:hypothetical protein
VPLLLLPVPASHCSPYILQGSVVQRLQRFATYTHLKQVVLRMITEDMRQRGKAPSFSSALQVRLASAWFGTEGFSSSSE